MLVTAHSFHLASVCTVQKKKKCYRKQMKRRGWASEYRRGKNYLCEILLSRHKLATEKSVLYEDLEGDLI